VSEPATGPAPCAAAGGAERAGPDRPPPLSRTGRWGLALLVALSVVTALYDLGGGAGFEPIDCWVAQTAREMRETPSWRGLIVPKFSGETRMQKSPGPYWAVIAATRLLGKPDVDAVSARLPSACVGIVIVLTVFWFTRRVAGERPALFAGYACAASAFILHWSHKAASDLGLAALTTISLCCLWVAAEQEPRGPRRTALWLLGYFAAGLGMLYKLPMSLPLIGVPVFLYLLVRRRWPVLRDPIHLLGLLVFLLPWLPWVFAVVQLEPMALAKWRVEFIDRYTGHMANYDDETAWYYYLTYLVPPLVYCLPFSLSLPQALGRIFRPPPAVDRRALQFLGLWFGGLFVFFTLSKGKEVRYFLPALPPLFVLLGIELAQLFNPSRAANRRRDRLVFGLIAALLPFGFAAGALGVHRWYQQLGEPQGFAWNEVWPPYAVTAVLFCAGATLTAWLYLRRREHASFAALVATMCIVWGWSWSKVMPIFVSQRPFTEFATLLRTRLDPEQLGWLRQVGTHEPRITWYGDVRFPRVIDQLELLRLQDNRRNRQREIELIGRKMVDLLERDEPVLFVIPRPDFIRFQALAPQRLAELGRPMPPVHLWLQARQTPKYQQTILFGNRPPPWPEEPLTPPLGAEGQHWANRAREHAPASEPAHDEQR
jgi:4-amino-4-deoxy-L-arabinose transferase-like glycosyltransferase